MIEDCGMDPERSALADECIRSEKDRRKGYKGKGWARRSIVKDQRRLESRLATVERLLTQLLRLGIRPDQQRKDQAA